MPDEAAKQIIDYLIVDSREERRAAAETFLFAQPGARVLSVQDGRAAREPLLEQQVEFVVAAFSMPWMNGIELLRFIRRFPRFFDLPVLILLDEESEEKILFAREEGADEVLVGAVTAAALEGAIGAIRRRRRERTAADQALLEAHRLFLQRQYDQAIQQVLAMDGIATNREALYLLCECYYRQKNFEKALQYLKHIIASPTSKTLHLLSKICLAENQCGDAITHLTKANLRYPSSLDLKIDLGKLYLGLGMEEQARGQFKAVLEANPSDLNLIKMGKAYLARNMLREATTLLDLAENPIPETAYIFAELAMALEQSGDLAATARQYEKCLRLVPDNPTFLLTLSKLYLKTDRRDRAETIIARLHQRFPDNEKINTILAYLQGH